MNSPHFAVRRSLGEGGCSMKITEDVRKYAAEQGIAEEEALKKGMQYGRVIEQAGKVGGVLRLV